MTKNTRVKTSGLIYPKPNLHAVLRLFCFPYAGATASVYHMWANGSLLNVEVCAIELPGRDTRKHELALTTIASQVDSIFDEIHEHLDKPFAFWGHSMGSIIAYELAQKLSKENGVSPVHLLVSGRQAPHLPDKFPHAYNLPEPDLLRELERLNGVPKDALESPDLMRLLLPILRADLEAIDTYAYTSRPALDCPITAFGGIRDREVDGKGLEGWNEHTIGHFSLRMLPGDHFYLHSAQQLLLRILNQILQRSMNAV